MLIDQLYQVLRPPQRSIFWNSLLAIILSTHNLYISLLGCNKSSAIRDSLEEASLDILVILKNRRLNSSDIFFTTALKASISFEILSISLPSAKGKADQSGILKMITFELPFLEKSIAAIQSSLNSISKS